MKASDSLFEDDLRQAIRELSHAYEELSLIYRFSETIAGLDVFDICTMS